MMSLLSGHGLQGMLRPIRVIKLHSKIGVVPKNLFFEAGSWRLAANALARYDIFHVRLYMKKIVLLISIILLFGCQKTEQPQPAAQNQPTSTETKSESTPISIKVPEEIAKSPLGGARDITVLIDPLSQRILGEEFVEILYRSRFPAHPEDVFKVRIPEAERVPISKTWQNTLAIALLDHDGPVSNEIRQMMSAVMIDEVQQKGIELYQLESVWAYDQTVFFLVARDTLALAEEGLKLADQAVAAIEAELDRKTMTELYSDGTNPDFDNLADKYGWSIEIPRFFQLYQESAKERVLMFRKRDRDPLIDRMITVHWGPAQGRKMTAEWARQLRDDVMGRFSKGDVADTAFLEENSVMFAGHEAVRLDGNWKNDKDLIGGPFRTYAVVNPATGNYYLVDHFILAIGMKKEVHMRQLNLIANTFRVE